MHSAGKALRLAGQQIADWPHKSLFWLGLLLNLNFSLAPVTNMVSAARALGNPLQIFEPYLLMSSYVHTCFLWMIGLIVFLSDAPFLDERITYIGLRVGRREWVAAQLLYVSAGCVFYALARLVFSLLLTAPYAYAGDLWSPTMMAIANNERDLAQQLGLYFPNVYMLSYYQPYAFLGVTVLLQTLYCLAIGMLIFGLNLLFSKGVGTTVALCAHNLGFFILLDGHIFANQRWSLMVHALPCYHGAYGLMTWLPTIGESLILFAGIIAVMAAVCVIRARSIDFSVPFRNL